MECIILAGGLGTRLQSIVSNLPKCMASVAGKPFLHYLLTSLEQKGFNHVILSLGYKHEMVIEWLKTFNTKLKVSWVVEQEPLGTGGALRFASQAMLTDKAFIINGDTYFEVDYLGMMQLHEKTKAKVTIALRKMENFSRFGLVELEEKTQRITQFKEKQFCTSGYINGGVYLIGKNTLQKLPEKCSLEKELFEKNIESTFIAGFSSNGYFIDIGVPEDYNKAQIDFRNGVI